MTRVHCYRLFAYQRDDPDGAHDLRRDRLPEWNLVRAIRWALEKGSDSILIEITGVEDRPTGTIHHVCADSRCPGGCS